MMDSMRKAAKSWVAKLLIGLLAVSFGVWGIADVFTGVEGTRIPSLLASGEMVYYSFLLRKPSGATG